MLIGCSSLLQRVYVNILQYMISEMRMSLKYEIRTLSKVFRDMIC